MLNLAHGLLICSLLVSGLASSWLSLNSESVRYLPDWFPGTSFKRYAKNMRAELDDWVTRPWELVKSHKVRVGRHLENVYLTMDRYRCRRLLVVLWINILI